LLFIKWLQLRAGPASRGAGFLWDLWDLCGLTHARGILWPAAGEFFLD
jgi:hypothetical protein